MTEKRFTKCCPKMRDNGEEMSCQEVEDMLNALYEENEQLKKQIKDCEHRISDKEVEWLRDNTIWEQMPSNRRTFSTTTSGKEDYK